LLETAQTRKPGNHTLKAVTRELLADLDSVTHQNISLSSTPQPNPIKGLFPFRLDDAGIFVHLQRERDLKRCLAAIKDADFRFGVLYGESGTGKTSFLQAGLWP